MPSPKSKPRAHSNGSRPHVGSASADRSSSSLTSGLQPLTSKPTNLESLQRLTLRAILRPLTDDEGMQETWPDGTPTRAVAESIIKPNDRLTSFERLEIYNRQYWFRLIDILHEDHPGLRAVVGDAAFERIVREYLIVHPSRTFALRDLGESIAPFLQSRPDLVPASRRKMALDMARFERAQTVAFDERAEPAVTPADVLGQDPATFRLALQPYLTLLALDYPLDRFSIRLRKNAFRAGASNSADESREHERPRKKIPLPKRQKTFVAVHRHDNRLYYKRLDPAAYKLLCQLQKGHPLEQAITAALPKNPTPAWATRLRKWFQQWTSLGWFHLPPPD